MATEARLALLPSPLLGPAVWLPAARQLVALGRRVVVPASYGAVERPDDVIAHLVDQLPGEEPLVLVPHSNAGLYVAALASLLPVAGVVFVDAGLPADGLVTPTASGPLREYLATLADDGGRLPAWTGWWPEEALGGLFPDAGTRAAVEAEQVRLPLSYFAATVPSPAGWEALPGAYLAFGDTYAEERARAEAHGWPTGTLAGEHLHQLVDPAGVSDAIARLVGLMGLEST